MSVLGVCMDILWSCVYMLYRYMVMWQRWCVYMLCGYNMVMCIYAVWIYYGHVYICCMDIIWWCDYGDVYICCMDIPYCGDVYMCCMLYYGDVYLCCMDIIKWCLYMLYGYNMCMYIWQMDIICVGWGVCSPFVFCVQHVIFTGEVVHTIQIDA